VLQREGAIGLAVLSAVGAVAVSLRSLSLSLSLSLPLPPALPPSPSLARSLARARALSLFLSLARSLARARARYLSVFVYAVNSGGSRGAVPLIFVKHFLLFFFHDAEIKTRTARGHFCFSYVLNIITFFFFLCIKYNRIILYIYKHSVMLYRVYICSIVSYTTNCRLWDWRQSSKPKPDKPRSV
jgi:hypothetical protein